MGTDRIGLTVGGLQACLETESAHPVLDPEEKSWAGWGLLGQQCVQGAGQGTKAGNQDRKDGECLTGPWNLEAPAGPQEACQREAGCRPGAGRGVGHGGAWAAPAGHQVWWLREGQASLLVWTQREARDGGRTSRHLPCDCE